MVEGGGVMSMDQAAYEALVRRMEALARERPHAYRRRILALAALGYGFLALIVLALAVLCAGLLLAVATLKALAVKLVLPLGALLVVVLRSLWVRLEPPPGEVLTRAESPELFAMLDRLRSRLATPPVHVVLATEELNAAIVQQPLLGLFGWHRNYLLVGLPLLKSLAVEQFEAVLAHELGHLSKGHARLGNWIYRLRLIWTRLQEAVEENRQWGSGVLRAFYRWYIPYFQASSFPLARANEYEADAAAVQLTSARSAAQALTNVNVVGSFLAERYWPGIHASARDTPQPAFTPYRDFDAGALAKLPAEEAQRSLGRALAERTTLADTHPCLADRLEAIGAAAELALPAPGEGAERLLGAALGRLEAAFDAGWRERIAPSWLEYHRQAQQERERLAELRQCAAQAPLSAPEHLEWARLEESIGEGAARALHLRRELFAREPESLEARFALAAHLLRHDDRDGVELMRQVIEREPAALLAGTELLRDFFWRRGDRAAADHWHARHVERGSLLHAARQERETVTLGDEWLPHGLDAGAIRALAGQLRPVEGLRKAWLVRKRLAHLPEEPLYVLCFRATGPLQWRTAARAAEVLERIRARVEFPGETFILNVEGQYRRFARKLWRCPRSRIL